jgi:hypothetical protein
MYKTKLSLTKSYSSSSDSYSSDSSSDSSSTDYCLSYSCYKYKKDPTGPTGPIGQTGATGPNNILAAADFYALMPSDNSATIAPGANIEFPNNGPNQGSTISRITASTFNLTNIGTYLIQFQVSIDEPAQLCIVINTVEQPYTVVGRSTGTNQIVGLSLITTISENSVISICNPVAESTALTITPLAGGTESVSAHLVILRLF